MEPIGIQNLTVEDRNLAHNYVKDWSEPSIKALFKLYHKYVSKTPSNTKCGACKSVVRNFWTNYLK